MLAEAFNKGNKLDVNPIQALGLHGQGFMETYAQEAEQTQDTQNQAQAKIFRQAFNAAGSPMVLLTTPEDIVFSFSRHR